jgi:hypothetical protein
VKKKMSKPMKVQTHEWLPVTWLKVTVLNDLTTSLIMIRYNILILIGQVLTPNREAFLSRSWDFKLAQSRGLCFLIMLVMEPKLIIPGLLWYNNLSLLSLSSLFSQLKKT